MIRLAAATILVSTLAAAEPPTVRELTDRLHDLEGQISLIERESALPVERAQLWAGAIRGMVESVDPHGGYLTTDEVAIYGLGSEPLRVGCGFDWRQDAEGRVFITRVVRGSPAAKAALSPGAEILAVNGLEPAKASRRQVAEGLARSGGEVRLRVLGQAGEAAGELTLPRVELSDDGISWTGMDADHIAMIRIGRFLPAAEGRDETATAAGLRSTLAAMTGTKAVVLDLRGCAGGNLQAAVEIAAAWSPPHATVVEQIGRDPARARTWTAESERLPDLPVVVLVDGGTASSAEVLAHALRYHRHAPVVGVPTVGKGTVQQLFLLPRGDAIRLTVARLRTPAGTWMEQPLQPDVPVAQEQQVTNLRWRHDAVVAAMPGPGTPPQQPADPQLTRACEIARALAIQPR